VVQAARHFRLLFGEDFGEDGGHFILSPSFINLVKIF